MNEYPTHRFIFSSPFFFQAEDGIRDGHVTGVQTCALPIFIDVKFAQIYGIDDDELNVEASLNAAGFSRADVTDVILTRISTSTMPAAPRLSQEIGMCPPSPMPRTTCRNATWHGRAHQTRGRKPPSFRRTSSRS